MAARLWQTIITRLTAPPLALEVHAVLVLAASFVIADTARGGWWAGPTFVAVVLWPLLRGSRLIWWVQLFAIGAAVSQALSVNGRIEDSSSAVAMFVDERTLWAVAAMLTVAWAALLLPSVRRYCRDEPTRRLGRLGFAVGVLMLAPFPTMALGIESWLPASEGMTDGGVFVGGDRDHRVAFYVEEAPDEVCFSIVRSDGGTNSCERKKRLAESPFPFFAQGVLADVVPEDVERVSVFVPSGPRAATVLDSDRAGVNVYYLRSARPVEFVRILGYDTGGTVVYRVQGRTID